MNGRIMNHFTLAAFFRRLFFFQLAFTIVLGLYSLVLDGSALARLELARMELIGLSLLAALPSLWLWHRFKKASWPRLLGTNVGELGF